MSKAILVIDMPNACSHCDLVDASHTCFGAIASTSTNRSDVDDYYLMETKPNWCPLKPLPKKKEVKGDYYKQREIAIDRNDLIDLDKGYNKCLDEILGETDNG